MHLTKEVAMLDGKRVSLESIDSDSDDLVLVEDDTAMLLAAWNLKALRVSKVNQLAMLFWIQVHYYFLFKPDTLFRECIGTQQK